LTSMLDTGYSISLDDLDGPRLLRQEELAASRRLDALCFPEFAGEVDEADDSHPTLPRRGGMQVICHRGEPVSQIGIWHSQVSIYGSPLCVASIGSVCTHPDYRGLGLATRLLDHCARQLTAEGARLMLVSGTRRLYTRSGCVAAQEFEHVVLKPGQVGLRVDGLALRPATGSDASLCSRLYQTEPVRFVRRVEAFTQHFCQPEEFPQAEDWIVEVGGRPVAYVFLSLPWENLREPDSGVREVCEYAGSRVALAGALAEVMARLDLRELRMFVPWQDADFLRLLHERGIAGERLPLPEHTMRIVNLPGLMSDLRDYVEARLDAHLRRGLRFEQEGDRYRAVLGREQLELNGGEMTRLVMGAPAGGVSGACGQTASVGEIIPALFPLPSFLPGLNYR
jgi:predicted N-acetyltransferase YhbS